MSYLISIISCYICIYHYLISITLNSITIISYPIYCISFSCYHFYLFIVLYPLSRIPHLLFRVSYQFIRISFALFHITCSIIIIPYYIFNYYYSIFNLCSPFSYFMIFPWFRDPVHLFVFNFHYTPLLCIPLLSFLCTVLYFHHSVFQFHYFVFYFNFSIFHFHLSVLHYHYYSISIISYLNTVIFKSIFFISYFVSVIPFPLFRIWFSWFC